MITIIYILLSFTAVISSLFALTGGNVEKNNTGTNEKTVQQSSGTNGTADKKNDIQKRLIALAVFIISTAMMFAIFILTR